MQHLQKSNDFTKSREGASPVLDHHVLNREVELPRYAKLEFQRIRTAKSIKLPQVCGGCGRRIVPGESADYISGVTPEIGFYYYYECRLCRPLPHTG